MKLWFVAIYLENSCKKGLSSYQLAKHINCTQPTAWFMLHRIREALKNNPNFKKLKGKTFEVDEIFIGGKQKNKHYKNRVKGTQGRSTKAKSPVLGILDRETGWVVPLTEWNLKSRGIKLLINHFVEDASTSTLHMDEYRTYRGSTGFLENINLFVMEPNMLMEHRIQKQLKVFGRT